MSALRTRRTGTALSAAVLTASCALVASAGTPALAAPAPVTAAAPASTDSGPPCRLFRALLKSSDGSSVTAYYESVCDDPEGSVGLPVRLQRRTASGWVTVASGTGAASVACANPPIYREYRSPEIGQQRYFSC